MLAQRSILAAAAVISASIAITACGGSEDETTAGAPVETTTGQGPSGRDRDRPATGDGRGGVELERVGIFDQPVYITDAPAERERALYVVEQCGRIVRVPQDGGKSTTFLEVFGRITCGGEQGLLSVAFHPDDPDLLYVYFTDTEGTARIVEYARAGDDPSAADPDSARELLAIDDFAPNHNGGLLLFGPDGRLYAGTGDGGGGGDPERTAQDPDSLLGKLLAIDTRDGDAEIVALGLRNPWRYSFDARTGDLWIGDVGQDALEEIDFLPRNRLAAAEPANFGWSAYEGTERFNADQEAPGAIEPVHQYGRDGGCSVTGGYVIRDRNLESLYGRYLYGDYCAGQLRSFTADPEPDARDDRPLGLEVPSLSSFGADSEGNYYVVSLEGPVERLVPAG